MPELYSEPRRKDRREFLEREKCLREELVELQFFEHWKEIAKYVFPRRVRFYWEDRARSGAKLNQAIINATAKRALRILSSGMLTGTCSPSRPWYRLQFVSPELRRSDRVRRWLDRAEETTRAGFAQSNFYDSAAPLFQDLGAWGIGAIVQDNDDQDVVRYYHRPIGTWVAATDARGVVDTLYSQVGYRVGQIAERWGLENASQKLKEDWTAKRYDKVHRLLHAIEPNLDFNPMKGGRASKRFRSVWLEMDCNEPGAPLAEGNGFTRFPALVPRWDVIGDLTYGDSPGMDALGDIKALQKIESLKLRGMHAIVNPAMNFPASMRHDPGATNLPGDVNWTPDNMPEHAIRPTAPVDPKIVFVQSEIERHEQRIMQAFSADLFLMLSMTQPLQKTAREVVELHDEKMLQLGPALSRVNGEYLKPAVLNMLNRLLEVGLLEPPPPEAAGHVFEIEFVSIMAQAQKLLSTTSVERFYGFLGNIAGVHPEVLDIPNWDASVRGYADMLGVPADTLNTEDAVLVLRQQRAAQQQLAQLAAAAKPAADAASAASLLSQTDVRGESALNRILSTMQPSGGLQ